jgi:hypothetical protein
VNTPKTSSEGFKCLLDRIKKWVVHAMPSDDELLEQLVLKGEKAMAMAAVGAKEQRCVVHEAMATDTRS